MTLLSSPSNPLNVTATVSTNIATVTWDQSTNFGGATYVTYIIVSSTGETQMVDSPIGSVTYSNLTYGHIYSFKVTATNSMYRSQDVYSNSVTPGVPGVPTNVSATAGENCVTVSFSNPLSNGGNSITSYEVNYGSIIENISIDNLSSSGTGSSIIYTKTITNLTQGVVNAVTVAATNNYGTGSYSASIYATPFGSPYQSPTNLIATTNTNGSIDLSWTPPTNFGNSTITNYNIYYYTDIENPTYLNTNNGDTTANVTLLSYGHMYTFYITAQNIYGTGPESQSITATPNKTPNAPTNVTGVPGNQSVTVSWTAPTSNGAYIDNYIVSYDSDPSHYVTVSGSNTSTVVSNLTNGSLYSFTVTAKNNIGSTASNASANIEPNKTPNAPTNLTVTNGENTSTYVTWVPPITNGAFIDNYTVEYKQVSSSNYTLYSTVSGSTYSIRVTGLTNLISYTIRVTSINNIGQSSTVSSSFTPDTPPNTVSGFAASVPQNLIGTVNFNWNQASTSGSAVSGYILFWNNISINVGNVLSYSLSGITTTGVSTSFSIFAYNSNGNSLIYSISVIPLGLPFAPLITQVTGKQNLAIVNYTPHSNTGGLSTTGYIITAYNINGGIINKTQAPASSTSTMITGLVGGSSVVFSVTSTNALGNSPESVFSSLTPINYTCFHSSTKILTLKNNQEVYVPINKLVIGDLIKTYKHGYIKIFGVQKSLFQNDFAHFSSPTPKHLYILPKLSYPELNENLILTGIHSLLVDNLSIEQSNEIAKENKSNRIYVTDDKYRLFTYLDPNAQFYNDEIGNIEVWNIALENSSTSKNYGIYVNGGLLVESLPICML